jgi:hypothetical protein
VARVACEQVFQFHQSTLPLSDAFAHCFVGPRFLPATLVTDDRFGKGIAGR